MAKQSAFEAHRSDPLLQDLNLAKVALHNWLNAEAVHWKQRAKINQLQDGDRNTKFFNLSAKSKGIRKSIDRISIGGIILEEEDQIRDQASTFFSNLLQATSVILDEALFQMEGPFVSEEQNKILTATPSPADIREAVCKLKRSSSPRLDGFSWAFFTNCWQIVGKQVVGPQGQSPISSPQVAS